MTVGETLIFLAATLLPSMLTSWLAVTVVRRVALRYGFVDRPAARKVHANPTSLGGGVAIWLGVVLPFAAGHIALALALSYPEGPVGRLVPEFAREHLAGLRYQSTGLWILLGGGTALMIVGLIDDLRGLDWRIRLALEFAIAALCVVWQGWRLTAFIVAPSLTIGLSVLWIVTLINSFNMLDNMDAASSGVAAIAATMLAAVMLLTPDPESRQPQLFVAGFLLVVVGSLIGFLWHNRPPARIFMGDAGSYFVGFSVAVATLLATFAGYRSGQPHAILAPVFVMAVPLYDMVTVIWIRLRQGRSPFEADKNHFSHRLVELGLTKGQSVLTIYLTTATCGLGALLLHRVDLVGAAIIMLLIVCVLALIAILESTARRKINR